MNEIKCSSAYCIEYGYIKIP